MPRLSRTPVRLLGVAFAIVTAVAFSPSRANAECGDYVHIGLPPQANQHQVPTDPATQPDAPRKPCEGPGCSGHPTLPTVPPVAPLSFEGKQWAVRVGDDSGSGSGPRWSCPAESDGSPIHISRSIFHPPRV